MCAEHVYMFTEISFLSYLTADRMMDHFLRSWKVIASRSGVLPVSETVYMITDLFLSGERCSGWFCLVHARLFFFFHVSSCSFLIHSIHVYKRICRALWWHIFRTKEGCIIHIACINWVTYVRSEDDNLQGHKCVIRFRTEIGQADDFNSLHDREREESTKSLSLPVTVCYVNSCNISDLCSFNLIISACLRFGS